jgi:hypothetical protein
VSRSFAASTGPAAVSPHPTGSRRSAIWFDERRTML